MPIDWQSRDRVSTSRIVNDRSRKRSNFRQKALKQQLVCIKSMPLILRLVVLIQNFWMVDIVYLTLSTRQNPAKSFLNCAQLYWTSRGLDSKRSRLNVDQRLVGQSIKAAKVLNMLIKYYSKYIIFKLNLCLISFNWSPRWARFDPDGFRKWWYSFQTIVCGYRGHGVTTQSSSN